MPAVQRPENGQQQIEGALQFEAEKKRRVDRVEFMLEVHESLHALRLMGANHNHTVALLDALITQAKALESLPGVKVNYFYNPKIGDFAVEAQEKVYGILPVQLEEDEEVEVLEGEPRDFVYNDEELAESDGVNEDDYEPIDSVDFYIATERLRNNLGQVALNLTDQIQSLNMLIVEIEDYEEEPGVQVEFYLDETNTSFSYTVKKRPPLGFNGVVEK